jgi:NAD(P)H-dependent FMN reductase
MLILAASNGHNLALARQVAEAAALQGHQAGLLDLVALELPLYTPTAEAAGAGPNLDLLAAELRLRQRLWVCAPEYNGSLPPALNNALAWLSRSSDDFRALFNGLPVALSTYSGGTGQKVLIAMRLQFAHLGCTVLGRELQSNSQKPANPESITAMLRELHRLPTPG